MTVGKSGAIWRGAGGLTSSRSRRPFRTAYLHFILIKLWYSLHSDRYARAAHMNQCFVLFAGSEHSMCSDADIIYSSQNAVHCRLWWAGCDEWQQNKDGVWMRCPWSTFNSSFLFSFFVLCLSYHFKWQTVSNLFIFLCCTFHCVNSKMLNEFSILTRLIK